ncbi:hypothetical protein ASPZODRAFT_29093 [Penicilliopsis zonata CBS 506.65]|uniref:DUF7730 domain-containing protein n=1 Tax=Penicilliopsis zonata CBS 506.65 TaxID=1073090 RepID=A0A1L9S5W4_9EURO|nr:hypothetical protein ASPZODRAFT_29093 [Penicilliopsis zonata CBS 506.65]OJJ42542.1 hypothetical protein ASPZODRAFT_29093 [Penicilliopsis zonata CBS 506.65]
MASIKKWFRKRVSGKKDEPSPLSQLPLLPAQRPHCLTPSASSEDLTSYYLFNYGSFGCLPPEIRREILILAFGARTIHVDLSFGYPLIRENKLKRPGNHLAPRRTDKDTHYGIGSDLVTNNLMPRRWQWLSCVCHRSPPTLPEGCKATPLPYDDECLRATSCSYTLEDGTRKKRENLDSCFIGVLGWLLACHMAYTEGIDVLFATNTFHFSRLEILENLPGLFLRQRLARITSLEINWHSQKLNDRTGHYVYYLVWPWQQIPVGEPYTPFHNLCRLIPDVFPHAHHLYISFQDFLLEPRGEIFETFVVESITLRPIEEMVRVLGSGRQVKVALPKEAFGIMLTRNRESHGNDLIIETDKDNRHQVRVWKALEPTGDLGYWIAPGLDTFFPRYQADEHIFRL